ncbi:hypothetical protein DL93DRAFT_2096429 [Clavulina sp. PMI_390]|nr:hypothetical protein DL93DRAFT_2096429 [Clavulina sp. PMI_390]
MRLRPVVYPQWEITDLKEVRPIPVHYDSDDELEIYEIASRAVSGTYTFESSDHKFRPAEAVTHARQRLMEQISNSGQYNFLVNEGWSVTTLRKSKSKTRRLEVRYEGRPAVARSSTLRSRTPPFLAVLAASA